MEVFFDTSVLVAASERTHPHYAQARPALVRVVQGKDSGFIGLHSVAELFAALTRLPVVPRIHPVEAARIIKENVLPHFRIVATTEEDYQSALKTVSEGGWVGGKIYDALLLSCAARSGAQLVFTFNIGDFTQLAPVGLRDRICRP